MGNVNTYRLKVNMIDGGVQYSEEIQVGLDFVENNRFTVFPNPSTGKFTLEASFAITEAYDWQISDVMGKVVMKGQTDTQTTSFDILSLSAGIYHLIMVSPEGKRYLNRVIVE